MLLGEDVIRSFYLSIINDNRCKFDLRIVGDEIVYLLVFFKNYTSFIKNLRTNFYLILLRLLSGKLSIFDIISGISHSRSIRKFIPNKFLNYHLGVSIFNPKFKKNINELNGFFKIYRENVESTDGCWGSCTTKNVQAEKVMVYFGGKIVGSKGNINYYVLSKEN